jgi:hypothetical protein
MTTPHPRSEKFQRQLLQAGIPELAANLKRQLLDRGFTISDDLGPVKPSNGELGFTVIFPNVHMALSVRANKKAKLIATKLTPEAAKHLGISMKGATQMKKPYWPIPEASRSSLADIETLLSRYQSLFGEGGAKMKAPLPRKISEEEIIRYAKANHEKTFYTLKQKRPFKITWENAEQRVVFYPESKTPYYPELEEYVPLYNESRSLKPSDYPKDLWCNSYFVSMLAGILAGDTGADSDTVVSDLEELSKAPETERSELIKCRLGQGKFRDALINLRGKCYVTGVSDPRLLRASHIKPWKDSTNAERLDPHNGLLLTPFYDHLFDKYLITFEDDGRIIVSKTIPSAITQKLHIDTSFRGRELSAKTRSYLAEHRAEFHDSESSA